MTLPKLLQEAQELNIPSQNCMKANKNSKKHSLRHSTSARISSLKMIPLYLENQVTTRNRRE